MIRTANRLFKSLYIFYPNFCPRISKYSRQAPVIFLRGHSKKCKRYSAWNSPWHDFPFRYYGNFARHGVAICGAITNGKRWDKRENCRNNLCYFNCWYFNSTIFLILRYLLRSTRKLGIIPTNPMIFPIPYLARLLPCSTIHFNHLLLFEKIKLYNLA